MLKPEIFMEIVDDINETYGSTHYLPAEYMFSDGVHFIKAFGKYVYDSDNCDATSPSTIKSLAYRDMNLYILSSVWKQQAECMKDDLAHILNSESVGAKELVDNYFEEELSQLGGNEC
jgi:hypothetical protein